MKNEITVLPNGQLLWTPKEEVPTIGWLKDLPPPTWEDTRKVIERLKKSPYLY